MNKYFKFVIIIALTLTANCGYNDIQETDETVKSSWAEVLNQYKRRADLVPQLVSVVKGYAKHEKETLTGVIEARSKATSVMATPELLNNPDAFKKFQAAQSELGSMLSKLMMVQERYPDLKANQNFSDLQAQLEGTENRITVARKRYIDSVKNYNLIVRKFPTNLTAKMFGYSTKPSFEVENEKEISAPPAVNFD